MLLGLRIWKDFSSVSPGTVPRTIGSQAPHQLHVASAGRCRHLGSEVFRELDRERANASSARGDEHLVAGLDVCTLLERLPRRQSDHRDRGRLHEVQMRRFERGGVLGHDRKLSESARAQPEDAGEDGFARLEAGDTTTHLNHNTRQIAAPSANAT